MTDSLYINTEIISGCKQRNRKSEYELYKLCYGLISGVSIRYGVPKQDLGDVINRIYLKVLNGLHQYNSSLDYRPWVKTIAVRTVIDYHRKIQRYQNHDVIDDVSTMKGDALSTYNEYEAEWNQEELLQMIQELPSATRQVFNLFAIDGFKHKEIGNMMSISENTSKWHVANARKILQNKLKEQKKTIVSHEKARYR